MSKIIKTPSNSPIMGRMDTLVNELCPDGVEKVKLGEVCEALPKGALDMRNLPEDGQYPVYNSGKDITGYYNKYNNDCKAITIASRGEYAGYISYASGRFWAGVLCYPYRVKENMDVNVDFLYYLLKNYETDIMSRLVSRGGIPAINKKDIESYEIPLPPLSIQQKIVSVLDSFTTLIDKMKQEVEKRKKQMEFYREKLLTFEDGECEWKYVSDVAENFTGLTYKPDNVNDTGTIVLRSSNIKNNMLSFDDNVYVQNINIPQRAIVKEGDILICVRNGSRALIGKCAMIPKCNESMAFGAFMTVLRANNMNSKYLFYAWQLNQSVLQYKGDDAMPINQITSKDFKHISIPVPPLDKQSEIVSTLDKFESYITKLEKMIVLRQKQYEYYREQLLTFE